MMGIHGLVSEPLLQVGSDLPPCGFSKSDHAGDSDNESDDLSSGNHETYRLTMDQSCDCENKF